MYSAQDYELYEAIRALSILKEMPDADPAELQKAEEQVAYCQENMGTPSEMALLSRLHWWTVEYGLIGNLEHPKIYGAGLLSSIGESSTCMAPSVTKLWYNKYTVNYPYDITKPQPQLFVTESFQNLIDVLEEFANTMSFRVGGAYGVQKAIDSKNTCTVVYSSGLQVSGVFTSVLMHDGEPAMIKTTGATALAFNNKQLSGQGKKFHKDGFSSPVGKIKGFSKPLEKCTPVDLEKQDIAEGKTVQLEFESGITLKGLVRNLREEGGRIVIITFEKCTVTGKENEVLFDPDWGVYDMAVGESIVSVFSGAADKDAFEDIAYEPKTHTYHPHYDAKTLALHELYRQVRHCRETHKECDALPVIWHTLQTDHPDDWLCSLEILEILEHEKQFTAIADEIRQSEQAKMGIQPELRKLIADGLQLLDRVIA
jgi:phenylalanine-4-hydroxylase